jgi:hypothetical protein
MQWGRDCTNLRLVPYLGGRTGAEQASTAFSPLV